MPTDRQQIIDLLTQEELDIRQLSQTLRLKEKEICQHLPHIAKSLSAQRKKIKVVPPACLSCGFVFKDRNRFTRPSRCPRCREQRIEAPRYRIV